MAEETSIPVTAPMGESAAITTLDIGAIFADELRVSSDEIMRAKGGDLGVYEQVLRDEQCYATFKQLRTDIISRETRVEPGGDRPIDIEAADDLSAQLAGISWDAITKKMLTGIWYGYSVGECMWQADSTRITLQDVKVRKAKRFRFDKNDQLRLIRTNATQGIVMPAAKFWLFKADADDDDDPYPLGLGYYCYWPVWFKRNMMRFWALWGEKFASPTPVAKFPAGAKEDERKKALALAKTVLSGAALAIPNTVALDLLEALARAGDDYELFCKYIDSATTKIVLCETMTTDSGSSRSQSETHSEVKVDVTQTYADLVCESFRRGPATWLTQWNHPGAVVPRIYRDFSESEDLRNAADRDAKLVVVGYRPSAQRVQETYGTGYEPISSTPQENPAPPAFAESGALSADASIERLIGDGGWEKVIGPEVDTVSKALDRASSLEDARKLISELSEQDPTAVTESLARVMFAAHAAGQLGVDIDAD